jgi:hypothetical protein
LSLVGAAIGAGFGCVGSVVRFANGEKGTQREEEYNLALVQVLIFSFAKVDAGNSCPIGQ